MLMCAPFDQRTALQNLKEVLELSGSSLEKLVKVNGQFQVAAAVCTSLQG